MCSKIDPLRDLILNEMQKAFPREDHMVRFSSLLVITICMCLTAGSVPASAQQAPLATAKPVSATPSWPRVFDRNGTHVVVYQPQLKAWQQYRTLVADTAISITDPDRNLSWVSFPGGRRRSRTRAPKLCM
jgi:hypothetical protein